MITAVPAPAGVRVVRPGARYAVHVDGDARPGAWLPDGEPLPAGWTDVFTDGEARLLLALLRSRTGGRQPVAPTTPDGQLVDRACQRLGVPPARLAAMLGADRSALSRARTGALPRKLRAAIEALLTGAHGDPGGA